MEKLVREFIQYIKDNNLPVEAICMSNSKGLILSETFQFLERRNIYSHSKSFTSLAIGIAIDEGKLHLNDRMVDVLKNEISKEQYEYYYDITLQDLLNMASGIGHGLLFGREEAFPDYLKFMLSQPLEAKPGTRFCYSNGDTYLATRMLEAATKMNPQQYFFEKIYKPLEIKYPITGTDPQGHVFGASEICLNCIDMNKLGIIHLNEGKYNGKQIVSKEYIKSCQEVHILTHYNYEKKWAKCDWDERYSNFYWIMGYDNCRVYRADGAYGQLTIIMPTADVALSFQCPENGDLEVVLQALRKIVLDKYFNVN